MKIEELILGLLDIKERRDLHISQGGLCGDFHGDHIEADELLLKYIDDNNVSEIFDSIEKWYS